MSTGMGPPLDRVDGLAKVTGRARYAAEQRPAGGRVAYAVALTSSIARGRIETLDTRAAESAPGVLAVITHRNALRLNRVQGGAAMGLPGQNHLVLQDERILYYGQYVALAVAESIEQAQSAARLIRIDYATEAATVRLQDGLHRQHRPQAITLIAAPPVDAERGDFATAFAAAEVVVDQSYTTPVEHHNAMEPHATTAAWSGERLMLWDSTQFPYGTKAVVAGQLGIPVENVRVLAPFVGGAFGSKGPTWPHAALAALAARMSGRTVTLALTRKQMFGQTGYRAATVQRVRLGATRGGVLTAIGHDAVAQTSPFDDYTEAASAATRMIYACPNLRSTHRLVRLDVNTPCSMRAPGEASGLFAVETAMDELAYAAQLDPLELRLRNYAETDPDENKPFSSKALRKCYRQGAERFGWAGRVQAPRSMREGRDLVGWGMATGVYPGRQSPATVRIRFVPDRVGSGVSVEVSSATVDVGTGSATVMAQVAADALRHPVGRVRFTLGDTLMPRAPVAAGSQSTASIGNAIVAAAERVLGVINGMGLTGSNLAEGLRAAGFDALRPLQVEAEWQPEKREARSHSTWTFGAHFCEVRVDEELGTLRVSRYVGAFSSGRIVNPKLARSQLLGSMIWGIGMALQEHTIHDARLGIIVNDDLAEYHVPVNADVPGQFEAILVEEPDAHANPLGVKGLGEIGNCGSSAAIANAVFHATGARVRDLPITLDKVLGA